MNQLYYGDNLDVLRRVILDESVDLIYLDPPFNSNRSYNVLFREANGSSADSQIAAFDDTWSWGPMAEATLREIETDTSPHVAEMIQAIVGFVGRNDVTAYLVMMTVRLMELHRVLKSTGSIYLHCDPTASHYLKIVMDTVFGAQNFRNEIIWQRTPAKALASRALPTNHDVILCYQKTGAAFYDADAMFLPYDEANLDPKTAAKYTHRDESGRLYQLSDLTNPNPNRPNLTYEFLGITKVWRWTKARMQAAYEAGLIVQPGPGRVPRLKRYLDEQRGKPLGDVWVDIPPINSQAQERLGYPTQKPLALLERIINASSNPGDLVLDPFCGCGTTITAAQKFGRQWIGIDITHLAVSLIRARLLDTFGETLDYEVIGAPVDESSAQALALQDRFEFEHWALGLIGARSSHKEKKGSDQGLDGVLFFIDDANQKAKKVVIQVKSGHVQSAVIRDLGHVIEREGAVMGFLVTLELPSGPMEREALSAGFYHSPGWGRDYPKIQIRTIAEILAGRGFDRPPTNITLAQADRSRGDEAVQPRLLSE